MSFLRIFISKNVSQNKLTKNLNEKYFQPISDEMIPPHTR